jgi:hypothetical protein
MMRKKPQRDNKSQNEAFAEAARELGCDESEARFDAALKKVARHKPPITSKPHVKRKTKEKTGHDD